MKRDVLVLDLDGTLVDSFRDLAAVATRRWARYGPGVTQLPCPASWNCDVPAGRKVQS